MKYVVRRLVPEILNCTLLFSVALTFLFVESNIAYAKLKLNKVDKREGKRMKDCTAGEVSFKDAITFPSDKKPNKSVDWSTYVLTLDDYTISENYRTTSGIEAETSKGGCAHFAYSISITIKTKKKTDKKSKNHKFFEDKFLETLKQLPLANKFGEKLEADLKKSTKASKSCFVVGEYAIVSGYEYLRCSLEDIGGGKIKINVTDDIAS